ncbi:DNA polymerase IV [Geomicrobium sp. JCM 19039]|nr:DNA polymerase IV [Geomicrobium sp. JCM 19039]
MTQVNITLDLEQLKDELMETNLGAVTKSAIIVVLNQMMEKERDEYLKASAYERSEDRVDMRNGYYEREYTMSLGKMTLKVPRTRQGEFSPSIFEKYERAEQSLVLAMLEMVINGVSTRKITKAVEQLCGESVSSSYVSTLTKRLDPIVQEWADRPLNVMRFPYLYVDAMYIKVREYQKVVSKAVYVAVAVNEKNRRQIIGFQVSHVESEEGWTRFFEHLQKRGFTSPRLIISDAHTGLKKAIQSTFVGSSWQRCTVHFKRNLIAKLPKKGAQEFTAAMKDLFLQSCPDRARRMKNELVASYEEQPRFEEALTVLDEGFEDAIQFMSEPNSYHSQLRTTNNVERLNVEIRRRERIINIFPNTQSAFDSLGRY